MAILSTVACLLALQDVRSRRGARAALLAGVLATALSVAPGLAVLKTAQSRGLSVSVWAALLGRTPTDLPTSVITFASGAGWRLDADVYGASSGPPRTTIVLAHGGAWTSGDKGEGQAWSGWLAEHGFLVVDVQYRLAPAAAWRDSVDDLNSAVAWVRAHASELGADPDHVVLMGRSAGGHLALLAAYTADAPPCAVVALYPPTDLALLDAQAPDLRAGMPEPASFQLASPVSYARGDVPSTLLIHGAWDDVVPAEHTRRLADSLASRGARVDTLVVPFARHAFDLLPDSLGAQLARGALLKFLAGLSAG
jgi:acetyl esterase/lipase